MQQVLKNYRNMFLFRGLVAIAFGIIALVWPGIKEVLEIISDEALVLNSRNLQERLLLAQRKSVYPGAHRIGSTGHVSTYD